MIRTAISEEDLRPTMEQEPDPATVEHCQVVRAVISLPPLPEAGHQQSPLRNKIQQKMR